MILSPIQIIKERAREGSEWPARMPMPLGTAIKDGYVDFQWDISTNPLLKITKCPLCGSSDIYSMVQRYHNHDGELTTKCRSCDETLGFKKKLGGVWNDIPNFVTENEEEVIDILQKRANTIFKP